MVSKMFSIILHDNYEHTGYYTLHTKVANKYFVYEDIETDAEAMFYFIDARNKGLLNDEFDLTELGYEIVEKDGE